eukprot:Phypoly_transcript_04369.p1 GENE.Phypoly_transcript_04369~~Phypoly_transcript_04369.p1  ORF type:complete len:679 (+),score=174.09 Phypoly_transcript_04369:109-2145(+)
MDKKELKHANEITKDVKCEQQAVADGVKDTIHDAKKSVHDLEKKTENMEIKDVPSRLLPSVEKIDSKLENLQESIEGARHAQVHDKNLENYSKIQQVMKDAARVTEDSRVFLREKTEDGTLGDTAQHAANLVQDFVDQSWETLDKLWTNWAALLTVVAAGSAGSWKQILEQSGQVISDLRYTEDFVRLLGDLKQAFYALSQHLQKKIPADQKLNEVSKEWETQRDKLLEDLRNVYKVLAESPIWNQLVTRSKAIKAQVDKTVDATKEQVQESSDKLAQDKNLKKLKEDLRDILQLAVGKDGPSVQPFLDYGYAAWDEIMNSDLYANWASDASSLFESVQANTQANQEEYQKKLDSLYDQTKEILDNTVRNENLRLCLRESKKLIRAAKKDPATRKLIADSQKLIKDISNKKGTGIIDPELLNEIRAVIVPVIVDHLDNAPLPDFHGHDENALGKYTYHLSDIRLGTTGLVPSKVKVQFLFKAIANPSELKVEQQRTLMYLEIDDIHVSFKDVKWQYNRETIPRFSDKGTIDLCTAGKGISIRLKAEVHNYQNPQGAQSLSELLEPPKDFKMFDIVRADVNIDDFHVRVSDAGGAGNVFYEALAGIWGTKIKHKVESLIEAKLRILATRFDRQLYDIVRRTCQPTLAQEAKATLLSAGQSAGAKIEEIKENIKQSVQSL